MARTAVTVNSLTAGTFTALPTPTTADTTNDHVVDCSAFPLEELFLVIKQTDASARVATIVAGDNPPALSAGQGNLTKSMAQNETWVIAGLESARFLQDDGKLNIDLAASFAGEITAYRIPRSV